MTKFAQIKIVFRLKNSRGESAAVREFCTPVKSVNFCTKFATSILSSYTFAKNDQKYKNEVLHKNRIDQPISFLVGQESRGGTADADPRGGADRGTAQIRADQN